MAKEFRKNIIKILKNENRKQQWDKKKAKDIIVFRFIIEYIVAQGIFIGPQVIIIIGLFLYEDF